MKPVLLLVTLIFCGTLLLMGCSSEPPKKAPKRYTVEIKQMRFEPAVLNAHEGDTVIFRNADLVTHNVTESVSKSWASGPLPEGAAWQFIVAKNADYYCSLHPVMKGRIVVR